MLQRPHAAMVVSDVEQFEVFRNAGLPGVYEARSYFSTLLWRKDPGSFLEPLPGVRPLALSGPPAQGPKGPPTHLLLLGCPSRPNLQT